jgi:hypothetical protein
MTQQQTPFATEQLLVTGSVKTLTAAVYKPSGVVPSMATISVEGGPIRYTVIGVPTPSSGHPAGGAQTLGICGIDSIAAFKAISVTTDATLTITYYRSKGP